MENFNDSSKDLVGLYSSLPVNVRNSKEVDDLLTQILSDNIINELEKNMFYDKFVLPNLPLIFNFEGFPTNEEVDKILEAKKINIGKFINYYVSSINLATVPSSTILTRDSSAYISLFDMLLEHLRPYLDNILENPEDVEVIAEKLLEDQHTMDLIILANQEVLKLPKDLLHKILSSLYTLVDAFKEVSVNVEDALDIFIEHETWKLKQIFENYRKYARMIFDFFTKYPKDANRYIIIYISMFLLLLAINMTSTLDKLKAIGEELNKLSEELETYTLTFKLAIDESFEKEANIIATAKTSEELRKALEIE